MSTSRASKHTWITKPFKQSAWLKRELFHAFQWLVRPTKPELRPKFIHPFLSTKIYSNKPVSSAPAPPGQMGLPPRAVALPGISL